MRTPARRFLIITPQLEEKRLPRSELAAIRKTKNVTLPEPTTSHDRTPSKAAPPCAVDGRGRPWPEQDDANTGGTEEPSRASPKRLQRIASARTMRAAEYRTSS